MRVSGQPSLRITQRAYVRFLEQLRQFTRNQDASCVAQHGGQIGRVAVLRDWRGLNVGNALMQAVIGEAERRGLKRPATTRPGRRVGIRI